MHFLISDFDATMSGAPVGDQSHTHKLTGAVIDFARSAEPKIDGVFCATARCYNDYVTHLAQYALEHELKEQVLGRKLVVNFALRPTRTCDLYLFMSGFLSHSLKNFSALTNLPIMGIATLSDVTFADCENCGDGYEKYILPYETAILNSLDLKKMRVTVPAVTKAATNKTAHGKKELLRNIAKRAIELHGNIPMTFSFLDDKYQHCNEALAVWKEFPNITAKIYWISNGAIHIIGQTVVEIYPSNLTFFKEQTKTTIRLLAWKNKSENYYPPTLRTDIIQEICMILVKNYFQDQLPFVKRILDGLEVILKSTEDNALIDKCKEYIDQAFNFEAESASKAHLLTFLDRLSKDAPYDHEKEAIQTIHNVF